MADKIKVSACIVTYNNADKILRAVDTVLRETVSCEMQFYLSDNASSDGTPEKIKAAFPQVTILENGANIGFGKAHNKVLPLLDSRYHAVLNPDISVEEDVIGKMVEYMEAHPEVVMTTPRILFPDGSEQHLPKRTPKARYLLGGRLKCFAGAREEYTRANEAITEPTDISFCTGCFMLIRTEVFRKLNGFDDRFFMYMEDADLTVRALREGKVQFLPFVSATHCWERSSAKSMKYLRIHMSSVLKFFFKYFGKRLP